MSRISQSQRSTMHCEVTYSHTRRPAERSKDQRCTRRKYTERGSEDFRVPGDIDIGRCDVWDRRSLMHCEAITVIIEEMVNEFDHSMLEYAKKRDRKAPDAQISVLYHRLGTTDRKSIDAL